ncbi:hypothetical protein PsAD2_04178 [Pseudovibrio axinellae]|uniref:GH64 domain-containing protein n=1 Tax=Pseudovibrio axinellae TaxID=989403 RepID=A0A165TXJ9_9HYPH|nr:beta-1,3-glucanase family protein [Pseudovibrio axinellae]KZL07809.1 hypothetical protein PsAD2_04178 [Pseudovibrio axinellae]SER93517.1 Beta-1,3-glucanase [Pseudovibrio axinellae]
MSNLALTITNNPNSGAQSSEVHVCIVGQDPNDSKKIGNYNFTTNQFDFGDKSTWQLDPNNPSAVTTLDKIKSAINIPDVTSGRIYFSIYDNFQPFNYIGPMSDKSNKTLFDKIEFSVGSGTYINSTSVDFYGISYVISGIDIKSQSSVSYGFNQKRSAVITALGKLPNPPQSQQIGNTDIMKKTFMTNDSKEVLRVLSPKSMMYGDWGSNSDEQKLWALRYAQFLNDYIAKHCFVQNRKFWFFGKDHYNTGDTPYFGKVSSRSDVVSLWTDESCTQPYSVQTLPKPVTQLNESNIFANYANVTGVDPQYINWGYLLLGNVAGSEAANHWQQDPVCLSIMVSICRGVMHLQNVPSPFDPQNPPWNDPTKQIWTKPAQYYMGDGNGNSTNDFPIFYYARILHQLGLNGRAYALSQDDVYGSDTTIHMTSNSSATIELFGLDRC